MNNKLDICAGKHGGDKESVAAFKSGNKERDRQLVFSFIANHKHHGAIADEFAESVGRQLNQVSGRFSELKKDELIVPSGEKRNTRTGNSAKVYVLPEFASHIVATTQEITPYSEYLKSETWAKLRDSRFVLDNNECVLCANPAQVAHHRRYPKILGTETVQDIVSLCTRCHEDFHIVLQRRAKRDK